jgi:ABC-type phosphate transport system substrate-binding protein
VSLEERSWGRHDRQLAEHDKFVASPKNDGVAATLKQTPGALGYIEYGFAKITKLPMAWLENKAGTFVEPTLESGQAALAGVTSRQICGPGSLILTVLPPIPLFPIPGCCSIKNTAILRWLRRFAMW